MTLQHDIVNVAFALILLFHVVVVSLFCLLFWRVEEDVHYIDLDERYLYPREEENI